MRPPSARCVRRWPASDNPAHASVNPPWPRRYRAYLFDLDGTLVDTAPDIHIALNHALDRHGHPPIAESLTRHFIGHGGRALVQAALAHHALPDTDAESMLAAFLEHYGSHIADVSQPYPTVTTTLHDLQAGGAHLAIVTNKNSRLTSLLVDALDLRRHFGAIVGGDTAPRPKPAGRRTRIRRRAGTRSWCRNRRPPYPAARRD